MAELPRLGTPMFLVHTEETNYRSRLEAVEGDMLSVAAPLETEGPEAPRPGQTVEIFWAQPRARVILPCKLVEITDSAPYRWTLKPIGLPQPSNRREFVRGGGGPAVQLGAEPEEAPLHGRLLDISEGGLRCLLLHKPALKVGDPMSAALRLETGDVEVTGTVHTVREAYGEPGYEIILIFRPDESTARLIRQHVFSWEIAERRREED
ncbi:PilZ domain-containing protein [Actinoplanes sp. CA-030573]|uniref:PilZ domain-containing protein n=1 Tax=Actinoplanes sp. CA-030573 TaxID=3239898 RepID=UPI003D9325D7